VAILYNGKILLTFKPFMLLVNVKSNFYVGEVGLHVCCDMIFQNSAIPFPFGTLSSVYCMV